MREFILNVKKRNNFMFMDRESGVIVSLEDPRCFLKKEKVSEGIERAVRNETLIELTKETVKPNINLENTTDEKDKSNETENAKEKVTPKQKAKTEKEKTEKE